MKRFLPNRPGRILALLGFFLAVTVLGWSAEKRVWVQYAPGAKGPVMAALASAGGRVHYEFDNIEAVAVSLPEQSLAGLSRNPNVALIEDDPIRVMSGETVPYGIEMVQAFDAQAAGGTGAGITIGVIDSGVFEAHVDLPASKISGYPDLGANNERTWYRDHNSHGTHVVGTICAVDNNEGVIGVAPGVGGIYMVKVFGDTGNWVYSSTLLAAVQQAVTGGGANIVSMSLGGGAPSQTESSGLQTVYNSGVLLIAAAGNGGNTKTSYPAGYPSVMSVAAVDSNKALATFSQRNSDVEIAGPGVGVLSTVSYRNASLTVSGTDYLAGAMEGAAQTTASGALVNGGRGTTVGSWGGKVVLVERGDISFADKVANVQAGGGVAAVIYNNVAGGFSGTLSPSTSAIPAISITQADGQALVASSIGQTAAVSTVANIDVSGYDYFDGTSMSTPHVSGVAALIWSKYPTATNAQVRQAMTETAEDLGALGRDNSFGWGLVRANNAMTRLGELVAGGGGGGDEEPPVITGPTFAKAKGKAGSFTIKFTTNEPATASVTVYDNTAASPVGTANLSLAQSFSVKVQGVVGHFYHITITATDQSNNTSAPVERDYTNN